MNIPNVLRYIAWYQYYLGRNLDYTPPAGGYVNHNETEWNNSTWNEPQPYDKPSWAFLTGQGFPEIGDEFARNKYAGDNFVALQSAVAAIPAISPGAHINDAATNAATNAPTNLNVVTTLLGSLTGEVNATNTKQNDLATKYNDLATKFNTLLDRLETNHILAA